MKVRLLYFSFLREKMKEPETVCDATEGETVLTLARRVLLPVLGELEWESFIRFAVNQEYVSSDHPLQDGDEVALIPPVAGG